MEGSEVGGRAAELLPKPAIVVKRAGSSGRPALTRTGDMRLNIVLEFYAPASAPQPGCITTPEFHCRRRNKQKLKHNSMNHQ